MKVLRPDLKPHEACRSAEATDRPRNTGLALPTGNLRIGVVSATLKGHGSCSPSLLSISRDHGGLFIWVLTAKRPA